MTIETPEQPGSTPDETTFGQSSTGEGVPALTGTDPQTPASDEEREERERQAEEANKPPADEYEGDRTGLVPTEIGDETHDLTIDQQVALRSLPTAATATDSSGTERIVVPDLNADGWTPNPVEPDPREVARVKAMQDALEAKKQARLDAMQVQS